MNKATRAEPAQRALAIARTRVERAEGRLHRAMAELAAARDEVANLLEGSPA